MESVKEFCTNCACYVIVHYFSSRLSRSAIMFSEWLFMGNIYSINSILDSLYFVHTQELRDFCFFFCLISQHCRFMTSFKVYLCKLSAEMFSLYYIIKWFISHQFTFFHLLHLHCAYLTRYGKTRQFKCKNLVCTFLARTMKYVQSFLI